MWILNFLQPTTANTSAGNIELIELGAVFMIAALLASVLKGAIDGLISKMNHKSNDKDDDTKSKVHDLWAWHNVRYSNGEFVWWSGRQDLDKAIEMLSSILESSVQMQSEQAHMFEKLVLAVDRMGTDVQNTAIAVDGLRRDLQ